MPAPVAGLFPVLHEDQELLILHKPAGLVCHPTKGDIYSSLVSRLRLYLGDTGRPELIHRLDRETSGVMAVAKTTIAAEELRRLWQLGLVTKEYLAIVHGHVAADSGLIEAPLGPDTGSPVAIKDCVRPDGAPSRTRYWVARRFRCGESDYTLLKVGLDTGRKHQIRIHLAHAGHPIVGDKLYGGDPELYLAFVQRRLTQSQRELLQLPFQALHAHRLWIPWSGAEQEFTADLEPHMAGFLAGKAVVWPEDT